MRLGQPRLDVAGADELEEAVRLDRDRAFAARRDGTRNGRLARARRAGEDQDWVR
jgi:hypothetical protein